MQVKVKEKDKKKEQATQCKPELASQSIQVQTITPNEDEYETLSQSSQGSMTDDLTGWNNSSIITYIFCSQEHRCAGESEGKR